MRSLPIRRAAAGIVATTLLAGGLAGCTTSGQDDATDGVLDVVAPLEPTTYNPIRSTNSQYRVTASLFDSLVGKDDAGQPDESGLATSWARPDDLTWELEIRDGVTFHDGSDLTAEDVAFSITQSRDDAAAPYANFYRRVESVEATGDLSLRLTTESPYSSLPALLTALRVVPSDYYEEVGPDGFDQQPVGSGPFRYDDRQPGQSLTLVRNDDYWGDQAQVETIKFAWSNDAAARVSLLQSGSADVAYDLPGQSLDSLANADGVEVVTDTVGSTMVVYVRANDDPTDDAELREAISLAIDRETIVDTVYGETAQVQTRLFSQSLADVAAPEIPHDPDRAREIVEGKGGPSIDLVYTSGTLAQDKVLGEAVAGMLGDAGFGVNQRTAELPTIYETAGSDPDGMNVYIHDSNEVFPTPDVFMTFYLAGGLGICVDPEGYTELSDEALAAADLAAAAAPYAEAELRAVTRDHCFVPIAQLATSYGVRDQVDGFQVPFVGSPDWTTVSLG